MVNFVREIIVDQDLILEAVYTAVQAFGGEGRLSDIHEEAMKVAERPISQEACLMAIGMLAGAARIDSDDPYDRTNVDTLRWHTVTKEKTDEHK